MQKSKWIVAVVIFLLVALWGVGKFVAVQKVKGLIDQANNDGNSLVVKNWKVSFRLLTLSLTADTISLDQRLGGQQLSGNIGHLELNDLKALSLLLGKVPEASKLLIDHPDLLLSTTVDTTTDRPQKSSVTIDSPILKIKNFEIINGMIRQGESREMAKLTAYGVDVEAEELAIPPGPENFATSSVRIDSLHAPKSDMKADWWLREITLAANQSLRIKQLTLEPRQTAIAMLTSISTKQSWNALRIDGISTSAINYQQLLTKDSAYILTGVEAASIDFIVFENPSLPHPASEPGKEMPIEQLRNLPLKLKINELNLPYVKVTYGCLLSDGKSSKLVFSEGDVEITNICTVNDEEPLVIQADFTFDESTNLNARFELDQKGHGRNFIMSGSMESYHLPDINPLMRIAADAIVETGQIHSISYQASVDEEVAKGEMEFRYSNLGVKLVGEGAAIKNLLKGIAVKKDNPQPDGDLRIGQIYHEHPKERPFFNLYWKAIVSGLQSTAVGNIFNKEELDAEKGN